MSDVKWCNQCESEQPITNFYNNKATKDGLVNRCKECCRQYNKKNLENIRIRNRYNAAHKKIV